VYHETNTVFLKIYNNKKVLSIYMPLPLTQIFCEIAMRNTCALFGIDHKNNILKPSYINILRQCENVSHERIITGTAQLVECSNYEFCEEQNVCFSGRF
jgi:hypothetical protein